MFFVTVCGSMLKILNHFHLMIQIIAYLDYFDNAKANHLWIKILA